jgi:dGTPase
MEWSKLLSPNCIFSSKKIEDIDLTRTPFQTDYDRIIFSENFRRLDKKTQVHPLKDNDHVHSRLPHSLEASSVGRTLGNEVGKRLVSEYGIKPFSNIHDSVTPILLGQILQTACLAHDIGNTPFGHAGEELMQEWFKNHLTNIDMDDKFKNDFMHFEGNAQTFRIVTRLAMSRNNGGIKPTSAMVASTMKYPWVFNESVPKGKFCCFQSERGYFLQIANECGLIANDLLVDGFHRHPFAYLSEASDDICYNIMDLEDAFELKILSYQDVAEVLKGFCRSNEHFDESKFSEPTKANISHMRAIAIGECVNAVVDEFFNQYDKIMSGQLSYKYSLTENCAKNISSTIKKAKKLANSRVFTVSSKTLLEVSANKTISTLLDNFCGAARDITSSTKPTGHTVRLLKLMGENAPAKDDSLYEAYMKVTDHISGMTDNYAVKIANHINGVVS